MRVEDYVRDNAYRLRDKIALIEGETRLSFFELDLMSERMAAALAADGVAPGDRVLVFMDNSWKSAVSIFALLKAGVVFSAVDPATPSEGLAELVEGCRAAGLVTQSRLATVTADAMARTTSLRLVVIADCQGAPAVDGLMRFEDAIVADGAAPELPASDGSDPAMIAYPSGSGLRHGVVLTHSGLDDRIATIVAAEDESGAPVINCALPFTVDEGLCRILAAARLGATVVLGKPAASLGRPPAEALDGGVEKRAAAGGEQWAI